MSAPRMLELVVLASGNGGNLRAIARAIDAGQCHARIVAVISDKPDALAVAFAEDRGIATALVPLAKGADRAAWNVALGDAIARFTPDLVVLAGFMRILGPEVIARFRGRIVNVHPSLLPAFPGSDGPAQAVRAGVRVSGCTVHLVDEGVDSGTIIAQGAVPVLPTDDFASLHARIQRVEHVLLPDVIDQIARGVVTLDPFRLHADIAADAVLLCPPISALRSTEP
jgi:phosphoribosylglycinamide formyltransferase-1